MSQEFEKEIKEKPKIIVATCNAIKKEINNESVISLESTSKTQKEHVHELLLEIRKSKKKCGAVIMLSALTCCFVSLIVFSITFGTIFGTSFTNTTLHNSTLGF